ncbi:MAG: hypothetical protein A2X12_00175 [Bacteroidetes bacterium GWE2_29_8]|nr:MAG: hypothetical protein A2X12_00175 [Bacteroidetes bacterium GWE2_29_8]
MIKKFFIFIILIFLTKFVLGNGLTISNVAVDLTNSIVRFDIKWQNSWRTPAGVPDNWDAVWVFVKFRDCSSTISTNFTHGLISTTFSDHYVGAGLQMIRTDGTIDAIEAAPENTGVLLRRSTDGYYPNESSDSIQLKLTNLPGVGANLDTRVYGIEMVYIPTAQFYMGDGEAYAATKLKIRQTTAVNTYVTISNENAIAVASDVAINIPAAYPKGYQSFYIMKYEITEGLYAEFLNTLTGVASVNRYPANYNSYRNLLKGPGTFPDLYTTTRPHRAQNFLSWADITAFLEWACLRPMSEMEYEKTCRGTTLPVVNEYSWGATAATPNGIPATGIAGAEDGTEYVPGAYNCNYWIADFTSGDGLSGTATTTKRGPVRVGIFANTSTSTRLVSGATYYGVMEMTGNVWEWAVKCQDLGLNFTREWGRGSLDANGNHQRTTWPSVTPSATVGVIVRGGSWASAAIPEMCQVSNRRFANAITWGTAANWGANGVITIYATAATTARTSYFGGRGVR